VHAFRVRRSDLHETGAAEQVKVVVGEDLAEERVLARERRELELRAHESLDLLHRRLRDAPRRIARRRRIRIGPQRLHDSALEAGLDVGDGRAAEGRERQPVVQVEGEPRAAQHRVIKVLRYRRGQADAELEPRLAQLDALADGRGVLEGALALRLRRERDQRHAQRDEGAG